MTLLETLQSLPHGLEAFVVSLLIVGALALVLGCVSRLAARWGF